MTTDTEVTLSIPERIAVMAAAKYARAHVFSWGLCTMICAFGEDGWGRGSMPADAAPWLAGELLAQIRAEIDAFFEKLSQTSLDDLPTSVEAYRVLFDLFDAGHRVMTILNEARSTARPASPGKIDA